jgi:hypothetical protein
MSPPSSMTRVFSRSRGDNKSNQIEVTGDSVTGSSGTTVNGSPGTVLVFTNGLADINIDMGNGEDTVTLTGGEGFIAEVLTVNINTGNGADAVIVNGVESIGGLNIDTGNGGDRVLVEDLGVLGNLNIDTGNGPDVVTFGPGSLGTNLVNGVATIDGGHGPDSVTGTAFLYAYVSTPIFKNFESILP